MAVQITVNDIKGVVEKKPPVTLESDAEQSLCDECFLLGGASVGDSGHNIAMAQDGIPAARPISIPD